MRRLCLLLLVCCATATAAPDQQEQEMALSLSNDLARSFVLAPELALDAGLRAAAEQISAAHLARGKALISGWIAEERQLRAAAGQSTEGRYLYFAVWARVLNELALWQLEPGDAAYESATLAALRGSPQLCKLGGDSRFGDYAARIVRIQQLPAAQRAAMLASERALLAHWGQQRPAPAAWPAPLPQDAALALLKSGQARPALPPTLAVQLLSEKQSYAAMGREDQCLLQLWWFNHQLQQGVAPATALNAFRYGTLIHASDRFVGMFEPPAATQPTPGRQTYPGLATRFQAEGATVLQFQRDGDGKPQQVSVIGRKVEVPGIRGVRPVAFENVFDAQAIKYLTDNKPPSGTPLKLQLVWKLEGAQP